MSKCFVFAALGALVVLSHHSEVNSKDAAQGSTLLEHLQSEPTYDEALATEAKADDYGMRKYVMAFLKAGPKRDQDTETAEKLQKAHLANIGKMAAEGKLAVAGPFMDSSEIRGIYIFNVETLEEAKALTESDPAVQAGRLSMELHPWYGSAAVSLITKLHSRMEKKSITK